MVNKLIEMPPNNRYFQFVIRSIEAKKFPPFSDFHLELPPVDGKPEDLGEVHLFTGVNGTGKTRILSVIAAMLGASQPLMRRLKGSEAASFSVSNTYMPPGQMPNRNWYPFTVHSTGGLQWLRLDEFVNKLGTIPAFAYGANPYVSDQQITMMAEVPRPSRDACLSFTYLENSKLLLQAIANLKIRAAMEFQSSSDGNGRDSEGTCMRLVRVLESTVSKVTGLPFRFIVDSYPFSLRVEWGKANLSFDLLPDGLRSILGWLVHALVMTEVWLQGKEDPQKTEAIFLLDEIESHLHPAWQRKILPAFQRIFPKAQIFVATHSPFVIASLNHGWIHPITLANDGVAKLEPLISPSKGHSYVTVVEEIMGIKEWYDPETEELLAQFRTARDDAFAGDENARTKARDLAIEIGRRSIELDYMMGREVLQMDRHIAKTLVPQ